MPIKIYKDKFNNDSNSLRHVARRYKLKRGQKPTYPLVAFLAVWALLRGLFQTVLVQHTLASVAVSVIL